MTLLTKPPSYAVCSNKNRQMGEGCVQKITSICVCVHVCFLIDDMCLCYCLHVVIRLQ